MKRKLFLVLMDFQLKYALNKRFKKVRNLILDRRAKWFVTTVKFLPYTCEVGRFRIHLRGRIGVFHYERQHFYCCYSKALENAFNGRNFLFR